MGRLFWCLLFWLGNFLLFPWCKSKLLASFLRQGVAVLVLNHSIEVQIGNALTNSSLANAEVGVGFNALPKIAFENGQSDVGLLLLLVCMDNVQNHKIVFIHLKGL